MSKSSERHDPDDEGADDRAGNRRGGKRHPAPVVDASLSRVRNRAGQRIEEHHHQADRGDRRRACRRIQDEQHWGEDEPAARADQGAKDADHHTQESEQDQRLERNRHDLRNHATRRPAGRVMGRLTKASRKQSRSTMNRLKPVQGIARE